MSSRRDDVVFVLGCAALAVLLVAGLVLATSWFVAFPAVVLEAALLAALMAMATVAVSALRESRRVGSGFFSTIGHMLRNLGRFVFWFF